MPEPEKLPTTNAKESRFPDTQGVLAFLLTLSFIGVVFLWMLKPPTGDAGNMAVLNTLVGILGATGFSAVVQFFFGSSKESKTKGDAQTALMERMSPTTPTNGAGTAEAARAAAAVAAPAAAAAVAPAAAAAVAAAAAAAVAPAAAAVVAPPAADVAAPPAAEVAVDAALDARGINRPNL